MSINLSTRTEIRELGSGGFGNTKLFEDDQKHRFVLKTFAPKGSNDSPKALAMFKAECDRLREVGNHPQIPSYLGFEESEGRYAIAQEYIPGRSLREVFDNDDLFTSEQALKLLEDLLDPLEHLHKNKVIHRDIKPANIIIHRVTQKPVLVDFGAAKVATETVLAQTGTVIGSFAYAAPEQAAGNGSFQSDIYSLGITIIEAMTGHSPVATGIWDWDSAVEGIDKRLVRILNMMTHRNLRDRFQDVAQIRREIIDLRRYSQEEAERIRIQSEKESRALKLKQHQRAELRKKIIHRWLPIGLAVGGIGAGSIFAFQKLQIAEGFAKFLGGESETAQVKETEEAESVDVLVENLFAELLPMTIKGMFGLAIAAIMGNVFVQAMKR